MVELLKNNADEEIKKSSSTKDMESYKPFVPDENEPKDELPDLDKAYETKENPREVLEWKLAPGNLSLRAGKFEKNWNSVYYNETKIEGADPETFNVLKAYPFFAWDKNNVYGGIERIEGADPKTFYVVGSKEKSLNEAFVIDANNVYYLGIKRWEEYSDAAQSKIPVSTSAWLKIEGADPKTFESVGGLYVKDKNNVYYKGTKIEGADLKTFELLNDFYTKDKNNVYYFGKKIEGADPKTFELLNYSYTKDKNNAYYDGKRIEGADPKTFYVLNEYNAEDENNVYYNGKKRER